MKKRRFILFIATFIFILSTVSVVFAIGGSDTALDLSNNYLPYWNDDFTDDVVLNCRTALMVANTNQLTSIISCLIVGLSLIVSSAILGSAIRAKNKSK